MSPGNLRKYICICAGNLVRPENSARGDDDHTSFDFAAALHWINAKQHRELILPLSWSLFSRAICVMSGRQFGEGAANIPRI
jgi:hypothetical protein